MTTRSEWRRRIAAGQRRLRAKGLYAGPIDGLRGPLTRAAEEAEAALARPPKATGRLALARFFINHSKGLHMLTFLTGYRTYIVAGMMLLTGVASAAGIDLPSFSGQSAGDLILQALAFFFLRQGLKTK